VLPNVPAIGETLTGYEAVSWAGIGAPAGTPAAIVNKLNGAFNAALAEPTLKTRLAAFGAVVMAGTPADFRTFIAAEIAKWAKVIKFANIRAD
jgi:tripartite-type tricarboxylate transporter receptor subunit TctC